MLSLAPLLFILATASSGNCQDSLVFPSNYTFNAANLQNRASANDLMQNRCISVVGTVYTTCRRMNGILIDFGPGAKSEIDKEYYIWENITDFQVLFTFSSVTVLTRVELFYYKGRYNVTDEIFGLPELRFYAVPEDYEFGSDLPNTATTIHNVSLCRGYLDRGMRSLKRFNVSQPTASLKVLMEKSSGDELFALTEVRFYGSEVTTTSAETGSTTGTTDSEASTTGNNDVTTTSVTASSTTGTEAPTAGSYATTSVETSSNTTDSEVMSINTTTNTPREPPATTIASNSLPDNTYIIITVASVLLLIFIGLVLVLILIFAILKRRKSIKNKPFRENFQNNYDQVNNHVDCPPTQTQNHVTGVHHHVMDDGNDSDIDDVTYDVIDNKRPKKNDQTRGAIANGSQSKQDVPQPSPQALPSDHDGESSDPSQATYAVVDKKKKKKKKEEDPLSDGDPPPVPEHTVDQLYASVHKKQAKKKQMPPEENDDDAPPIPPYTIED